MAIIFGITAFLFLAVLPVITIVLLIKPQLLKKLFKVKKPHRGKIFAITSGVALVLFVIMGFTVPPKSAEQKLADANAATMKQQQQVDANKTKLIEQQSKNIAKETAQIDKQNTKIAKNVEMHNSEIEIGNNNQYTYKIVSNSNIYDVKLSLLDKNKNQIDSTNINHSKTDWSITSKYSPDKVKYITYAISIGSKYYDSHKVLKLSNTIKDYPGIANNVVTNNTQIIKDQNLYSYVFSMNSRAYDAKIEFYNNQNTIIYTKDINHSDKTVTVNNVDLKPVSMGGTVAYIKTKISINTKLYETKNKLSLSSSFDDKDAARVAAQQKAEAAAAAAKQQAANEEAARQAAANAAAAAAQPKPSSSSAYYANCSAARSAGVTPIYRGQPGYSTRLDRDNDGVACE